MGCTHVQAVMTKVIKSRPKGDMLFWVTIFFTARPWAERGSCSARRLFFVFSVTRPKLLLGHIVSGNHATYDVYSPKDVNTLMYLKFYEYSALY